LSESGLGNLVKKTWKRKKKLDGKKKGKVRDVTFICAW